MPPAAYGPARFPNMDSLGRLPAELRAEPGRVLSRWGDAGWGRMVADDKHANHFRDDLLVALAEMIQDRWRPQPAPTWVACIPSQRHPDLVPDLARRLADRLALPFVAAIPRSETTDRRRSSSTAGTAAAISTECSQVQEPIPFGPVLLVDDVVDSAWTLTVAAVLLRRGWSAVRSPCCLGDDGSRGLKL